METDPHRPLKENQMKTSSKYKKGDGIPTKCKKINFIYAVSNEPYPSDTPRSGKYILFFPTQDINTAWNKIKTATIKGLLGDSSKVSTKIQKGKRKDYLICVYTYDSKDMDDRSRIEGELLKMGFNKFSYKTNEATLKGFKCMSSHM